MTVKKTDEPRRNASGVCLEERIQSGMTKFFFNREEAMQYAKERRSYYQDCFQDDELIGYVVPN